MIEEVSMTFLDCERFDIFCNQQYGDNIIKLMEQMYNLEPLNRKKCVIKDSPTKLLKLEYRHKNYIRDNGLTYTEFFDELSVLIENLADDFSSIFYLRYSKGDDEIICKIL